MIVSHTSRTDLFDLGRAELLLDAGHTEYGIANERIEGRADQSRKLTFVRYYDADPDNPKDGVPPNLKSYAEQMDLDGFEQVLHVSGPVYYLGIAFYRLAMDLDPAMDPANYTPGGDDDTFDYWPSGMRLLHAFACDLDAITGGTRYVARYVEVVRHAIARNVPELDVPLTEEVRLGIADNQLGTAPDRAAPVGTTPPELTLPIDGRDYASQRIYIDEDGVVSLDTEDERVVGYLVARKP